MTRVEITNRLRKLDVLARRGATKAERATAKVKADKYRAMLKSAPYEGGDFMTESDLHKLGRVRSSHANRYDVDVSDTNSIGDAFKKAFKVAFEDIKAQHRKG